MWEKRKKEERLGLWIERNGSGFRRGRMRWRMRFAGIFRAVRGKHGGRCV